MPQATFVLKEPTSKEDTLVYLLYRFNGSKLKYSTGQKINPKFWNPETQRAREVRTFKEYAEFNSLLNNLETEVNNTYRKLLNDRHSPTPDLLRSSLNIFLQKERAGSKDLIGFADLYIETIDRKPNTKKQLRQALRNLKEYKQASKASLHLDSIDLDFYDGFVDFLLKKNYGKNTIGTVIKNVKVFMNEAVDRKLTQNLQFKNRRFKTVEEPSDSIYLTEKEIKKIYNLELAENPRIEKVRDLFVFGCYTGLRFSDFSGIGSGCISKDGLTAKINTIKTGETVVIPLGNLARSILIKYKNNLPQAISNQKMNEYLKELGQLAGIDDSFVVTATRGGKRETEIFKKWELITTHTPRRSFATNAYLQNVPTISIMKITGHRTEKSFLKYIKISQEDNANKLVNHPFFK
jgi:integrase